MVEKTETGLTPEEEAYFESGGETPLATSETPTEAAQTEPAAEPAGGPDPAVADDQPRDEKGRFVPHQALHAEREEHKKTRAELQELKEFRARMEERQRWMEELARQNAPQEQAQPANVDDDIFSATKRALDEVETLKRQIAEEANQRAIQADTARQQNEIVSLWQQDSAAFSREVPDFGDAAKFLSDLRTRQLEAMAVIDPRYASVEARNQQINAELFEITRSAKANNQRPAEVIYTLAKANGYAPASAGADPANARIAQIERAQQASRTVSQGGGKAGGDALGLEDILAMPRGEFSQWVSDPKNEAYFNKLMGA